MTTKTTKSKKKIAPDEEKQALLQRIAELEQERDQLIRRTNFVVAEAQERCYWLDRWNLDLNALMQRPGAKEFRGALRAIRHVVRIGSLIRKEVQKLFK